MFHRNMLLGGAVFWLTACAAPLVGQAVLKTDQQRYAPGSELKLQLQNESFQPLGYNLEGTYRYVIRVDWEDALQEVVSNTFSVAHTD